MNILPLNFLIRYPQALLQALADITETRKTQFYIAGGTIRDWLQDMAGRDLDITVAVDGYGCAKELAERLGGSFVALDAKEDVARAVWRDISIDISGFREGAETIEEDLAKRDFTINAMAVPFMSCWVNEKGHKQPVSLIDPTGGVDDLKRQIVRSTSNRVFVADPLRLLRAYRFMACLGFGLDPKTENNIRPLVSLTKKVAVERLAYELDLIIASDRAYLTLRAMHESGLLQELFPELLKGEGIKQPASHHLDVFEHSLATLFWMEKLLQQPGPYFPGHGEDMTSYLVAARNRKKRLKWSALFHDLGKPDTYLVREEKGGRITFYNHDAVGARLFKKIAARFKWSNEDTKKVARFIERHMWPFHLNNARQKSGLTPRAYLKFVKAVGKELPGLFFLAMADSLAGRGEDKPQTMEEDLISLYEEASKVYQKSIKPVLESPRLLTGHDLRQLFGLPPGPVFREIFDGLEGAQVTGEVGCRQEAISWVKAFLNRQDIL